jgi:SET domain-containing protein
MFQVIREWLPSRDVAMRANIDATRTGNVARFFNHRCGDPNVALQVVHRTGEWLPIVALATSRDVCPGEELTFSYGDPPDSGADKAVLQACHCGSERCAGFLPVRSKQ